MRTSLKTSALRREEPPEAITFEREDWALFRTVEGLQQRGGVAKELLRRLVMKELTDNAFDAIAKIRVAPKVRVVALDDDFDELNEGSDRFLVEDNGPGIDPDEVPRLFSINRRMISTKLQRLPTRGALGNGLRVVVGAVLASEGSLVVTTRNRRLVLEPNPRDGSTTVVEEPRSTTRSAPASRSASGQHCRATKIPCCGQTKRSAWPPTVGPTTARPRPGGTTRRPSTSCSPRAALCQCGA